MNRQKRHRDRLGISSLPIKYWLEFPPFLSSRQLTLEMLRSCRRSVVFNIFLFSFSGFSSRLYCHRKFLLESDTTRRLFSRRHCLWLLLLSVFLYYLGRRSELAHFFATTSIFSLTIQKVWLAQKSCCHFELHSILNAYKGPLHNKKPRFVLDYFDFARLRTTTLVLYF